MPHNDNKSVTRFERVSRKPQAARVANGRDESGMDELDMMPFIYRDGDGIVSDAGKQKKPTDIDVEWRASRSEARSRSRSR